MAGQQPLWPPDVQDLPGAFCPVCGQGKSLHCCARSKTIGFKIEKLKEEGG